ncbi:enoyl-CoA hydratase/isomerase family protein [Boseongicola aestuarii]|uniref:Putative enoyl-CoA hydratase echA6 n=1 Tax=Boseongicola aestuarii TaxID=1470561 RepID=A0A238IXP7_9RHOB|nr:enoyl-CoA hydratase/isomerase family protein [Boseongicola aestuarii]SMX23259.1 putative enoyl-CoA hydratase echA6 [Boseongicola aestuarii]
MIERSFDGEVLTLTLNRPDKANALTGEMLAALADAVEGIGPDVCAVVLTGAGRVFSAGADLEAARAGLAVDPVWERLSGAIAACPALTVAALNGTAAGGALGMVLASDLRVAVPGASMFYPVMKLGFLPQPSDPARMVEIAGGSAARRVFLAGEKIGAHEAKVLGLLDAIETDVMAAARGMVADACAAGQAHVAAIKGLIPSG